MLIRAKDAVLLPMQVKLHIDLESFQHAADSKLNVWRITTLLDVKSDILLYTRTRLVELRAFDPCGAPRITAGKLASTTWKPFTLQRIMLNTSPRVNYPIPKLPDSQ